MPVTKVTRTCALIAILLQYGSWKSVGQSD